MPAYGEEMKKVVGGIVILVALGVFAVWSLGRGFLGHHDSEVLTPVEAPRSAEQVANAETAQRLAADAVGAATSGRQILFGDLHPSQKKRSFSKFGLQSRCVLEHGF